jgi:hypothetical protein
MHRSEVLSTHIVKNMGSFTFFNAPLERSSVIKYLKRLKKIIRK